MICFNPGPLVIRCFANCTTLTHSSCRKRFHFAYRLSEKPFTEISLQMVSVPGPDFEYAPLSRPSLSHRLNNSCCIIHQRSCINNKSLQIKDNLVDKSIDILALAETWLRANECSDFIIRDISPTGYAFVHIMPLGLVALAEALACFIEKT